MTRGEHGPIHVVFVRAACRAAQLYAGLDMHIGPHHYLASAASWPRDCDRVKDFQRASAPTGATACMALVDCMRPLRVALLTDGLVSRGMPHRATSSVFLLIACMDIWIYEGYPQPANCSSEAVGRGIRQDSTASARCKHPTSTPRIGGRLCDCVSSVCDGSPQLDCSASRRRLSCKLSHVVAQRGLQSQSISSRRIPPRSDRAAETLFPAGFCFMWQGVSIH